MNPIEKEVIRVCSTAIVTDLNAKDIAPLLYEQGRMDSDTFEELFEINESRRNICQRFLLLIVKSCPFPAFLDALRHENHYGFLATKLQVVLESHMRKGFARNQDQSLPPPDYDKTTKHSENASVCLPVQRIRNRDSSHTRNILPHWPTG